jgi:subtilase family serine protease
VCPRLTLLLFFIIFPLTTRAEEWRVLRGHVPPAVQSLEPVGRLPADKDLQLAISLPLRNNGALEKLLHQIYDPADKHYHQYLAPQEFTARFGPTEQDYETVIHFATTNGLTVVGIHSNRVLLDVSGPVSAIEKAFHITLRLYQHPVEGRIFFAPDTEPSVASTLPVLNISGLDNFVVPHPRPLHGDLDSKIRHGTVTGPQATGSGPGGYFIGSDLRSAYLGTNGSLASFDGIGQSVGLFESDGYYTNDIATYERTAGLTNFPVVITNVLIDGFDGSPGGANDEVALDIEMIMAMAPAARVIVYEGPHNPTLATANDVLNRMATDDLASQLSSSWYYGYATNAATEQIYLQFAAQGQSFFQASGDDGSYFDQSSPEASPNVTTVGGTTLATSGTMARGRPRPFGTRAAVPPAEAGPARIPCHSGSRELI